MSSGRLDKLKARPGWPDLDNWQEYYCTFEAVLVEAGGLQGKGRPRAGSFEGKAPLLCAKWAKQMKREASALHHACNMLAEFQRPGSKELKRELAGVMLDRLKERQQLEKEVLAALIESVTE